MNSLLQRLADDNPNDQYDDAEGEDKSDVLVSEILLLLSSRPLNYHVENIRLINESIINYGVSDVFTSDTSRLEKISIMQARITLALQRFEPRLKSINVYPGETQKHINSFVIEAEGFLGNVRYHLMWDDVLNQFFLRD
ncbi:hypothetical protein D8682_06360 [Buttiauxella sp. 3AFRM03]|uniref:hypothetical protein n=1 Tax=Buttiauxella TaxID=82976 RepID=UPI000EF7CB7D|nr:MULTISPECIES: hypothetical protein [Buttiauxella]AYN26643.1 hypothetical protein D8682_06360 [Buttiauxella sp. 3AFRM03]TDN55003.1 type VI secretion system protein ImpF [Buttiauxella sp. JUb87]UNK62954.1 hypothetical protein MNO13_08565 [Buttiauxella ferragutiae]